MLEIRWVGSSKEDLRSMPSSVKRKIGFALSELEEGRTIPNCKPLAGFGSAKVCEIRENDRSGTYRAVYTTMIRGRLYVLHAFQKKSIRGIETGLQDMALIKQRLNEVEYEKK